MKSAGGFCFNSETGRTRAAPAHDISMIEPEIEKNGTRLRHLTAFTSSLAVRAVRQRTPSEFCRRAADTYRLLEEIDHFPELGLCLFNSTSLRVTLISLDWSWIFARLLPKVSGPGSVQPRLA
jgi:hypothetical protein